MQLSMPELRWSPVASDADAVLAEQVRERSGGPVVVGRLCSRCGSSSHGRPWARVGNLDVPVSISRAGDLLVTAIGRPGSGGIGVDVEVLDPDAGWPVEQMLAAGEVALDATAAARLWVTKEAILKVEGVGLTRPMSQVAVAAFDGIIWEPLAPHGYVVAVALRG